MANTEVRCPNCGSFATKPTHGESEAALEKDSWATIASDLSFGHSRFSFENLKWVQKFKRLEIGARCETCHFIFQADTVIPKPTLANASVPQRNVEERLAELERLHTKGLVTDDEYKRKRDEILRNL